VCFVTSPKLTYHPFVSVLLATSCPSALVLSSQATLCVQNGADVEATCTRRSRMDGTEEDEAARDKRARGIAAIERAAAKASAARADEEKDDARPAAASGDKGAAADADAVEWACSVCTVLNVPSFLACSVCGSERRGVAAAAVGGDGGAAAGVRPAGSGISFGAAARRSVPVQPSSTANDAAAAAGSGGFKFSFAKAKPAGGGGGFGNKARGGGGGEGEGGGPNGVPDIRRC